MAAPDGRYRMAAVSIESAATTCSRSAAETPNFRHARSCAAAALCDRHETRLQCCRGGAAKIQAWSSPVAPKTGRRRKSGCGSSDGSPGPLPPNVVTLAARSNSGRSSFECTERALKTPPRLDHAGDRPGLGRRADRRVRRLCSEDFADGSEPGIEQVIAHRGEALHRQIGVAMHAVFGQRVMAEQPRPYGALMVSAVTMADIAGISRLVFGMAGCERPQSIRGEQPLAA